MSQNEQYRINKRKASASPPPESTRSWIDNNLDVNDPEDSGVLIKISLPSIQDKEDFHRTTLVLIEKLSTHMWNDLLCHVPIRQNRRHLSRVLGKFGFVSKHDGALLQYILDVPCAAACVCASAPEEKQPLDRCDNPDRNRRVKERAEQLDKFFLDHDRFCDLGPLPCDPPGEGTPFPFSSKPDPESMYSLLEEVMKNIARKNQIAYAQKKASQS